VGFNPNKPDKWELLSVRRGFENAYAYHLGELFESLSRILDGKEIDTATVQDFVEELHLPEEVVFLLVKDAADLLPKRGKWTVLNDCAMAMSGAFVQTLEEAQPFIEEYGSERRELKALLKRLGVRGREPTLDERDLYRKWRKDWGFSADAIAQACPETTKTLKPSMAYLNGVLERLRVAGAAQNPAAQLERERVQSKRVEDIMRAIGYVGSYHAAEWNRFYLEMTGVGFSHGALKLAAEYVSRSGGKLDALSSRLKDMLKQSVLSEKDAEAYFTKLKAESRNVPYMPTRANRPSNNRPSKEVAEHRYENAIREYAQEEWDNFFDNSPAKQQSYHEYNEYHEDAMPYGGRAGGASS